MMSRPVVTAIMLFAAALIAIGVWQALASYPPNKTPPPPQIGDESDIDPMVVELIRARRLSAIELDHDAGARLDLAHAYHANALIEQAMASYRQTLQLDPHSGQAWYGLARAHERLGEIESALHAIDRAISLEPSLAFLRWRRGYWLLDLGRIDEARGEFEQAIDLDSSDLAARAGLARVHLARNENERAEQLLSNLLAKYPDDDNSQYIQQLLRAAQRHLGDAPHMTTAITAGTASPPFHGWSDPWDDRIDASRTGYEASIEQASHLLNSRKIDAAIALLNRVLQYKPGDVGALNYLSLAQFRSGKDKEGFELLELALAADPDHYATHLNLSRAYAANGDANRAMEHVRRAIELNPAFEDAYRQLVQLLLAQGKDSEAAAALEAGIDAGISSTDARVTLGRIQLQLQRWSDARATFETILRVNADDANAHRGLAQALAELGEVDLALQHRRHADSLDPGGSLDN